MLISVSSCISSGVIKAVEDIFLCTSIVELDLNCFVGRAYNKVALA